MRPAHFGRKALDVFASHGRDDWFRIVNRATDDAVDLYLYNEIGWFGTPASKFIDDLEAIEAGRLNVHINSLGGDVFDGIAIFNTLRQHDAFVTVTVDSMAASIASVIAQAGDDRVMVTGSQMMIHDAWGLAVGDADAMREYADVLDKQSGIIAGIYAERSGVDVDTFRDLMAAETWMNHDETVTNGLADRTFTPTKQEPTADDKNPVTVAAAATATDWSQFVTDAIDQEITYA